MKCRSKKSKTSEQETAESSYDIPSSKIAPPDASPKIGRAAAKPDRKSAAMDSHLKTLTEEQADSTAESSKVTESAKVISTAVVNGGKKESPYDHLPCEASIVKEGAESAEKNGLGSSSSPAGGNSPPTSPRSSNGRASPEVGGAEDFSTLDYIPRSSPTVQARSITPEHAQHLRKLSMRDGGNRVTSSTVRGKRSPPNKMAKKSNTMAAFNVDDLHGISQSSKPDVANRSVVEDEGVYNVPRPSSAADLYKVPKSILDSPPTGRSNGLADNTYDTPKAAELAHVNGRSGSDEGLYKEPSSIPVGERETYSTPRPGNETYDTPRTGSSVVTAGSETYDSPRPTRRSSTGTQQRFSTQGNAASDAMYSTPRPVPSHTSHDAPSSRNNYESIDADMPTTTTTSSNMRPARSFESLHRFRLATPEPHVETKPGSPPPPSTGSKRVKCEYVDIDLEELKQTLPPAKNAPLPPLPTTHGPAPITDGVYAEITEEAIASNRMRQMSLSQGRSMSPSSSRLHNVNPQSLYNELPPPRPKYPDTATKAQEGMAKAKELAEEEGYELFLPAELEQIRRPTPHVNTGSRSFDGSSHPPTAGDLLEKYHINIHDSNIRGRPYSESDVLDDTHSGSSKLATSIPTDAGEDEYIIVTGPDRRPKSGDAIFHHYPPPSSSGGGSGQFEGGSFEGSSYYATPNPTLRSGPSSVPQPQAYSPTYPTTTTTTTSGAAVPFTRQMTPKQAPAQQTSAVGGVSSSPPLTRRQDSETPSAGVNLGDMMSPADPTVSRPFFDASSAATNASRSRSSSGERVEEGEGQAPFSSSARTPSLVKVMAGSPLDRANSIELK